jgi:site-specific DNA-methyltransferase (adenine-specific)
MNSKTPYSSDKNINLYHTESLEWLAQREEKSVDLIFLDPPYFLTDDKNNRAYKGDWDLSNGVKQDFKFHNDIITQCRRVLKDDGVIWITGTHHNIFDCGFSLRLNNFKIINLISWYKPSKRFTDLKNNLAFDFESIIFARKNKDVRHYLNWSFLTKSRDKFHVDGQTMPTTWDIKTCPRSEIDWHPTPKPLELLKRIIMLSTKPDALILDPFNGSGTTAIATLECGHGRRYIGLDMDKNYLDRTLDRLEVHKCNEFYKWHTKKEQQKTALRQAENVQNIGKNIS